MRRKLSSRSGRAIYDQRKTMVEPVIRTLKEQRGMKQFKRRGLPGVTVEFTLAAIANNIMRLHRLTRVFPQPPGLPRFLSIASGRSRKFGYRVTAPTMAGEIAVMAWSMMRMASSTSALLMFSGGEVRTTLP